MFSLVVGYTLAHPQAPGWAGIWQNGMWTSPDDDMDNISGRGDTNVGHIFIFLFVKVLEAAAKFGNISE